MRKWISMAVRTLVCLILTVGTTAAQQAASKQTADRQIFLGPNAGLITSIALDPLRPNIIYAGGPEGGIFKTTDGGVRWADISPDFGDNTDVITQGLAIDRKNANTVMVASWKGAYKSTDGGRSWACMYKGIVNALAFNPTNSQIIYAGIIGAGGPRMMISTDGGANWNEVSTPTITGSIKGIAVSPANSKRVYAITAGEIIRSTDGGATWAAASSGVPGIVNSSLDIAADPADPQVVYATIPDGIIKTVDGGANWKRLGTPQIERAHCVTVDPANPKLVYAATNPLGIIRSTDGGATWAIPSPEKQVLAFVLAVDSRNHMLYAGDGNGFKASADGGATWKTLNAGIRNGWFWTVTVDPRDANTLYAGSLYYGGFKSTDGGASWRLISPHPTAHVAVDPSNSQILYAQTVRALYKSNDAGVSWNQLVQWPKREGETQSVVSRILIPPSRPQTLYTLVFLQYNVAHGMMKSTDGGASWQVLKAAPAEIGVRCMAVDPNNADLIYVGGRKFYKSTDGGQHWSAVSVGQSEHLIESIAIARSAIYATGGGKLIKSTDGGAQWTPIQVGANRDYCKLVAIAPSDEQTVYVAGDRLISVSKDGGEHWRPLPNGRRKSAILGMAVAPSDADALYTAHLAAGIIKWDQRKPQIAAAPAVK